MRWLIAGLLVASSAIATAAPQLLETPTKTRRDQLDVDHSSVSTAPLPFDTGVPNNFTTSSCPTLFNKMLSDQQFLNCRPVSLYLETSNTFFDDSRSMSTLNSVFDASCAEDVDTCKSVMDTYASSMNSESGCGADYQLGNPIVMQAYNGLVSYEPLYYATCLKDAATGNYCYSEAATSRSDPDASYLYYLALGQSLPTSYHPACNNCTSQTLGIFSKYAKDSDSPLNVDFETAMRDINEVCGSAYVSASMASQDSTDNAASGLRRPSTWIGASLAVAAVLLVQ